MLSPAQSQLRNLAVSILAPPSASGLAHRRTAGPRAKLCARRLIRARPQYLALCSGEADVGWSEESLSAAELERRVSKAALIINATEPLVPSDRRSFSLPLYIWSGRSRQYLECQSAHWTCKAWRPYRRLIREIPAKERPQLLPRLHSR